MPLDLIETQTVTDDGTLYLDGPSQIASVSIGGVTYVVAAAAAESGLTVFSLSKAGVRYLVLPDTVRGGFGADAALTAISEFFDEDGSNTDSIAESSEVKEYR